MSFVFRRCRDFFCRLLFSASLLVNPDMYCAAFREQKLVSMTMTEISEPFRYHCSVNLLSFSFRPVSRCDVSTPCPKQHTEIADNPTIQAKTCCKISSFMIFFLITGHFIREVYNLVDFYRCCCCFMSNISRVVIVRVGRT